MSYPARDGDPIRADALFRQFCMKMKKKHNLPEVIDDFTITVSDHSLNKPE
jgi:hypothetical protein